MNFLHSRKPYFKVFSASMKIIAEMIKLYFVKLQFMVVIKIFILYSFTHIQYLFSILYAVSLYLLLYVFLFHLYISFFCCYFITRFIKEHIFYKFHVHSFIIIFIVIIVIIVIFIIFTLFIIHYFKFSNL